MGVHRLLLAGAATALIVAGCQSGDRLLVSNTTTDSIDIGARVLVPPCSNVAFVYLGAWIRDGDKPDFGPLPSFDGYGISHVTIGYRPPPDGFGSTRTVAIVSSSGVEIRQGAADPPSPVDCSGRPPATPTPPPGSPDAASSASPSPS
jgi:hypothetical protein